jgi:DNA-binding NarL/FixJ family response regulator
MSVAPPVRVLVVDDQTLVRHGIRSLLELTDEVVVIGEAGDGDAALDHLATHEVDVLLLDLRMPGRDGVSTLRAMTERGISVPTLVLTTFDDDELVLAALHAGAKGYMLKDVTLDQLVGGVQSIAAGGTLLMPSLTERLLRAVSDQAESQSSSSAVVEKLTAREADVLRLAAAGWSNREIAHGLHLAEGTVKNHMSSVLLKLGVRDRTRAVLRALETGLLVPGDRRGAGS